MPYNVIIQPRVQRQIVRWPMPDTLMVDCYLQLRSLRENPARQLIRVERPFDGMVLARIAHRVLAEEASRVSQVVL